MRFISKDHEIHKLSNIYTKNDSLTFVLSGFEAMRGKKFWIIVIEKNKGKEKEIKGLKIQLENIKHNQIENMPNIGFEDEIHALRKFKNEYEVHLQKLTSDFYTLQSQNIVLSEKLSNFEKENHSLKDKTVYMVFTKSYIV